MNPFSRMAGALSAVVLLAAGCAADYRPPVVADPIPEGVQFTPGPDAVPTLRPEGECDPRVSLPPDPEPPRRLVEQGFFRAGIDQNSPRMSHRDPVTNEFHGFDIDILLEIAKAMYRDPTPRDRIRFVPLTTQERLRRFGGPDGVDVAASSITATCDRAEQVALSSDYLDSGQTVLVRGDSPYQSVQDLAGKGVCAPASTTSIWGVANRPEGMRPVATVSNVDCLVLLHQGKVEAISTDHNVLLGIQDMDPSLRFLVRPPAGNERFCTYFKSTFGRCHWFTDEPHSLAFGKDDAEFVRFANHVLKKIRENGRWQEIHDKWLKDHPDHGPPVAKCSANDTWPPVHDPKEPNECPK